MANSRKKISELPALSVASLDTTFVLGISGSTTYKISINNLTSSLDGAFATDLVTSALSNTLDTKLSTSSFNSYTASISTGSLVTSISNLNTFTASVSTASLVTSISNLNTFTASQSTSSLVDRLNVIESVSGSWITESETGSFLTSLSGAISSSSQLTSSYDNRYVISGSITHTTWDNIANKPFGIVSQSTDLTPLNSKTGSYATTGSNTFTGNNTFSGSVTIGSGGGNEGGELQLAYAPTNSTLTGSAVVFDVYQNRVRIFENGGNNRGGYFDLTTLGNGVSTNLVPTLYLLEAYANDTYTLPGSFTEDPCRYSVVNNTVNVSSSWFNTSTYTFTPQKAGYWEITAAYDVYRNTEASMAIKKNNGIVAAAGSFGAVAQQVTKIVYLNGSTDFINIVNFGGAANSRPQYEGRSWFQSRWVGE